MCQVLEMSWANQSCPSCRGLESSDNLQATLPSYHPYFLFLNPMPDSCLCSQCAEHSLLLAGGNEGGFVLDGIERDSKGNRGSIYSSGLHSPFKCWMKSIPGLLLQVPNRTRI